MTFQTLKFVDRFYSLEDNQYIDVSNLQPNGTGTSISFLPREGFAKTSTKAIVPGLNIASSNAESFRLAIDLLEDPGLRSYIPLFEQELARIKPLHIPADPKKKFLGGARKTQINFALFGEENPGPLSVSKYSSQKQSGIGHSRSSEDYLGPVRYGSSKKSSEKKQSPVQTSLYESLSQRYQSAPRHEQIQSYEPIPSRYETSRNFETTSHYETSRNFETTPRYETSRNFEKQQTVTFSNPIQKSGRYSNGGEDFYEKPKSKSPKSKSPRYKTEDTQGFNPRYGAGFCQAGFCQNSEPNPFEKGSNDDSYHYAGGNSLF